MVRFAPRSKLRAVSRLVALAILLGGPACVVDPGDEPAPDLGQSHSNLTTANGIAMNGLGSNGIGVNGIALNGVRLNGVRLNGVRLNGVRLNGLTANGVRLNGVRLNGVRLNGVRLNGVRLNGLSLNGVRLNGVRLNGFSLEGVAMTSLDAATQATLEKSLVYLGQCALSPNQTMSYTDLAGATRTVTGVAGLDPTWLDAAPDLGKTDVMATCVQDRAAAAGDAVAIELADLANFKKVLQYLVECALPDGHALTYYDENEQAVSVAGSLGLAPEWETGAPTLAGERYVSACLAARTNALGQTVRISIRAPALGGAQAAGDTERASYDWSEGAFWGDLFAATPSISTCVGQGPGIAGRLCTVDGTCGFSPAGQCDDVKVCASKGGADGAYASCGGADEVVSTYLPISTEVSFGLAHTCVRQNDGQIRCYGENLAGAMGDGSPVDSVDTIHPPTAPSLPSTTYLEVASTFYGSCARSAAGKVFCWGEGVLSPVELDPQGAPVTELAINNDYLDSLSSVCALHADGSVACGGFGWGFDLPFVAREDLGSDVARIVAGPTSCALKSSGDLYCWGENTNGEVGDGTQMPRQSAVKVLSGASDVARNGGHTCARRADGVWCWGDNTYGDLGNGTLVTSLRPTPIALSPSITPAVRGLAVTTNGSCLLSDHGTVWCWGMNDEGQVGNLGVPLFTELPVPVLGLPGRVVGLSAGAAHNCARLADDRMFCWGWNALGQLGTDSPFELSKVPVEATKVSLRPAACGDGTCASGESTANCPADCGSKIGDFACNGAETPTTAPTDCGVAGDGLCTAGEDCGTNPADCGACAVGGPACIPICTAASCGGSDGCGSTCGRISDDACPCDDGNPYTTNDAYAGGVCQGAPGCGDGTCNGQETAASCPADCALGITTDAFSSLAGTGARVSSLTWSHTTKGGNRLLVVGVGTPNNVGASGVTFGDRPLTLLRSDFYTGSQTNPRTQLWYLVAPPLGTGTIAVTLTASTDANGAAASFDGVSQATPVAGTGFGNRSSGTTTSRTPSVSTAASAGQVIVDLLQLNNSGSTIQPGSGQTQRAALRNGGMSTKPGASSTTMAWTLGTASKWALSAVAIRPAP